MKATRVHTVWLLVNVNSVVCTWNHPVVNVILSLPRSWKRLGVIKHIYKEANASLHHFIVMVWQTIGHFVFLEYVCAPYCTIHKLIKLTELSRQIINYCRKTLYYLKSHALSEYKYKKTWHYLFIQFITCTHPHIIWFPVRIMLLEEPSTYLI